MRERVSIVNEQRSSNRDDAAYDLPDVGHRHGDAVEASHGLRELSELLDVPIFRTGDWPPGESGRALAPTFTRSRGAPRTPPPRRGAEARDFSNDPSQTA